MTLPYERRSVRANSASASVKSKGSKTERQGQQVEARGVSWEEAKEKWPQSILVSNLFIPQNT